MNNVSKLTFSSNPKPLCLGGRWLRPSIGAFLGLLLVLPTHAQWTTQSLVLKAGWNAVYLHVDASHSALDSLVGADHNNPIQEIWLWNPAPTTLQFVQSPQQPTGGGTQWSPWVRSGGSPSPLQRLIGNAAYLVRVDGALTGNYTWNLKGRVIAPRYEWTTTGLNFLGFPTPAGAPPTFESFLALAPSLEQNGKFFQYIGGSLGPENPRQVQFKSITHVNRGEAFWINSADTFNRYFGPFDVRSDSGTGVEFGASSGQSRLRLRNVTTAPLTVNLRLMASEDPPAGQPGIVGIPPMLVRGPMNNTNLTYSYSNLISGDQSWILPPQGASGSEIEVVLGLDRSAMIASTGSSYAGILRFTDSRGLSQVDIPVSALVASAAGLWVGEASINQVRHYLKAYQKDGVGNLIRDNDGRYIAASTNSSIGEIGRPFPLRLILHHGTNGNTVLMQRVYYGQRSGIIALATRETSLDSQHLKSARRLSAAHLPFSSSNQVWNLSGEFRQGGNLSAIVASDYDDHSSNPFVHTYHPDHDNLNATFDGKLPQGGESFSMTRQIKLTFTVANDDFQSVTSSGESLIGEYDETLTISAAAGESRSYDSRGHFTLNRISSIPLLTQ